jgi:hypothetical protein
MMPSLMLAVAVHPASAANLASARRMSGKSLVIDARAARERDPS